MSSSSTLVVSKSFSLLKSCKSIQVLSRRWTLEKSTPRVFIRTYSSASGVELTSVRYKDHVQRGNYATLQPEHVSFFREKLGDSRVITDGTDVDAYNVDWLRIVRGGNRIV